MDHGLSPRGHRAVGQRKPLGLQLPDLREHLLLRPVAPQLSAGIRTSGDHFDERGPVEIETPANEIEQVTGRAVPYVLAPRRDGDVEQRALEWVASKGVRVDPVEGDIVEG